MKWLIITILLIIIVSCKQSVDKYNVTDTVYMSGFTDRETAAKAVKNKTLVLCAKHGFTKVKILSIVTFRARSEFAAQAVGKCYGGKDDNQ